MNEAQYSVYNDLEASEARMLMPSKVHQFPELISDATTASGTPDPGLLPECVGVEQVGLSELTNMDVLTHLLTPQCCQRVCVWWQGVTVHLCAGARCIPSS